MKHAYTRRSNVNSKAQANMHTSRNNQCSPRHAMQQYMDHGNISCFERERERQAGRQAGRQTGRQAGRQAGRDTDRQTDRQRNTFIDVLLHCMSGLH